MPAIRDFWVSAPQLPPTLVVLIRLSWTQRTGAEDWHTAREAQAIYEFKKPTA